MGQITDLKQEFNWQVFLKKRIPETKNTIGETL